MITTNLHDLDRVAQHCNQMRREILFFSGLGETTLDEVSTELSVDYEIWCCDYKGPDLADAFMGFSEMLRGLSFSFDGDDESTFKGLTSAQYYFAWAYGQVQFAIGVITGRSTLDGVFRDGSIGPAVVSAIGAAKALIHAKHLYGADAESCIV